MLRFIATFTITEIILAPFVLSMAIKYAPALRGGIAALPLQEKP